jgi:hypothetical protein
MVAGACNHLDLQLEKLLSAVLAQESYQSTNLEFESSYVNQ